MPFIPHTPEALLSRNDSKNPATTCKGITASGRPCRRALGASPSPSPTPSPSRNGVSLGSSGKGVLAMLRVDDLNGSQAAAFYCWQHKDQAEHLATGEQADDANLVKLTKRSSVDTLVDRLGILEIDEGSGKHRRRRRKPRVDDHPPMRRDTLPQAWHDVPGPLMTVPENALEQSPSPASRPPPPARRPYVEKRPKSNVKASFLCCVTAVDDDYQPPPRQHQSIGPSSRPNQLTHQPSPTRPSGITHRPRPSTEHELRASTEIRRKPIQKTSVTSPPDPGFLRPSMAGSRISSHTGALLSLIPSSLSPQTTSLLLNELVRPISAADEAGYIYMFWLTPSNINAHPDDETASSLLAPPSTSTSNRRGSDAIQRYATVRDTSRGSSPRTPSSSKTVLLKIGRASNVHRRLNQWNRQCGHNVNLIRYYPYNQLVSNSPEPRQVPHVHRVERLVHLELSEKRAKDMGACESCGREHREWFEIPADREGVKKVDETIRRWVSWAEQQDKEQNSSQYF